MKTLRELSDETGIDTAALLENYERVNAAAAKWWPTKPVPVRFIGEYGSDDMLVTPEDSFASGLRARYGE